MLKDEFLLDHSEENAVPETQRRRRFVRYSFRETTLVIKK